MKATPSPSTYTIFHYPSTHKYTTHLLLGKPLTVLLMGLLLLFEGQLQVLLSLSQLLSEVLLGSLLLLIGYFMLLTLASDVG